MSRSRTWIIVAPTATVIVLVAAAALVWSRSDDSDGRPDVPDETLDGAALFAELHGETQLDDVREGVEPSEYDPQADELSLHGLWAPSYDIAPGPDGTLLVSSWTAGILQVNAAGLVVDLYAVDRRGGAITTTSEGKIVVAEPATPEPFISTLGSDGYSANDAERLPVRFGAQGSGARFDVLVAADNGNLLFADGTAGTIESLATDGTQTRLLGGPDDRSSQVQAPEPFETISGIVPLQDGSVAFVGDTGDGNQLYKLTESQLTRLETDEPVLLDGGGFPRWFSGWPVQHLTPGPRDTLITTGLDADGAAVIAQVDPTNGQTTTLARLPGLDMESFPPNLDPDAPDFSYVVSTAVVGHDLFILADNRIWRLEGVFGD